MILLGKLKIIIRTKSLKILQVLSRNMHLKYLEKRATKMGTNQNKKTLIKNNGLIRTVITLEHTTRGLEIFTLTIKQTMEIVKTLFRLKIHIIILKEKLRQIIKTMKNVKYQC